MKQENAEERNYLVMVPVYTWVKASNLAGARSEAAQITSGLSRLPMLDAGAASITVWDEQGNQLFPTPKKEETCTGQSSQ